MDAKQLPPDPGDIPIDLAGVDGDPARLLTLVRNRRADRIAAERDLFLSAAVWAEMLCADSVCESDWLPVGGQTAKPIAGAGCPLIAELAVAEYAVVLEKTAEAGRRFVGQAVECRYRLPHLWAQVEACRVQAWQAAQIAEATMALSADAAAFVDARVACHAAKTGTAAALARLITEAITRFDPALAEQERKNAEDQRNVTLRFGQSGGTGIVGSEATVALDGLLGYADARDLQTALQAGAADLAALGSVDTLGVRRAQALDDKVQGVARRSGAQRRAGKAPMRRQTDVLRASATLPAWMLSVTGCARPWTLSSRSPGPQRPHPRLRDRDSRPDRDRDQQRPAARQGCLSLAEPVHGTLPTRTPIPVAIIVVDAGGGDLRPPGRPHPHSWGSGSWRSGTGGGPRVGHRRPGPHLVRPRHPRRRETGDRRRRLHPGRVLRDPRPGGSPDKLRDPRPRRCRP